MKKFIKFVKKSYNLIQLFEREDALELFGKLKQTYKQELIEAYLKMKR
jgi:hypothetical protein